MSPFEKVYHRPPNVTHLKVLGCLCYAKDLSQHDKMLSRVRTAIRMGYSTTQKGNVLLDITNNSFFVNRDVIFKEDIFPFVNSNDLHQSVFLDTTSKLLESDCWFQNNVEIGPAVSNNPTVGNQLDNIFQNLDGLESIEVSGEVLQPDMQAVVQTEQIQPEHTEQPMEIRKSDRSKKPPVWMKDFVSLNIHDSSDYGIDKYLNYDKLSSKYQAYIAVLSSATKPKSYSEALKDPRWI